jgi:glucokinase
VTAPEVGPHVVVTLDAIYTLALETRKVVDRIEESNKDSTKILADHEARIRALEQARWKIIGAGTGLGFVAGLIPTVTAILAMR